MLYIKDLFNSNKKSLIYFCLAHSCCGKYDDKLKGEKIYHCKTCKLTMDRDINACRNIYIKTFYNRLVRSLEKLGDIIESLNLILLS